MENIAVSVLLLDEGEIIVLALILGVIGGVAAHRQLPVGAPMRRVTYLWCFVLLNVALTATQMGWRLVPAAADEGLLPVLVGGLLSSLLFFGAGIYWSSAGRSLDAYGDTSKAWLGFVPVANLWLFFKKGGEANPGDAQTRSGFARSVLDPLLVLAALFVFAFSETLSEAAGDTPAYNISDSAALAKLVSDAQTVEEGFASEADASRSLLPFRLDEITILSEVKAQGRTLSFVYDIEREGVSISSSFRAELIADQCRPEIFGRAIARGGQVIMSYRGPHGNLLDEFVITSRECAT